MPAIRWLLAAALAANLWGTPAGAAELETQALQIRSGSATHDFTVEVADEPGERATGLMNRREMAETAGMLFDFGEDRAVTMWMKNTYLSLDMLFIDKDGVIRSLAERTTPLSERTIASGVPVRYVLELNAGTSDRLGIKSGDRVEAPAIGGR